jgi:hypothetical protein
VDRARRRRARLRRDHGLTKMTRRVAMVELLSIETSALGRKRTRFLAAAWR